jgi:hypothetical protein
LAVFQTALSALAVKTFSFVDGGGLKRRIWIQLVFSIGFA